MVRAANASRERIVAMSFTVGRGPWAALTWETVALRFGRIFHEDTGSV